MSEPQFINLGNIINFDALLRQAEERGEMIAAKLNKDGTLTEKPAIIDSVGEAGVGQAK